MKRRRCQCRPCTRAGEYNCHHPRRVCAYTSCPHCNCMSLGVTVAGRIVRHSYGLGSVQPRPRAIQRATGKKYDANWRSRSLTGGSCRGGTGMTTRAGAAGTPPARPGRKYKEPGPHGQLRVPTCT